MTPLNEQYQLAKEKLRQHQFSEVLPLLNRIYRQDPLYRSVCYYLGKVWYFLGQEAQAEQFFKQHLQHHTQVNRAPSYYWLALIMLHQKQGKLALDYLQQAQHLKPDQADYQQLKKQILKDYPQTMVADATVVTLPKNLPGVTLVNIQQAHVIKTGVVHASLLDYQGATCSIYGLTPQDLQMCLDGKQHRLEVLQFKQIPNETPPRYQCLAYDQRTFFKAYLPIIGWEARFRFNDYLEKNPVFREEWKKSKVFSLLKIPKFTPKLIQSLLKANHLIDHQVLQDLMTCKELVLLKQKGETLYSKELSAFPQISSLRRYGLICEKHFPHSIHLASKCAAEEQVLAALRAHTQSKWPLLKQQAGFSPTTEQKKFIAWFEKQTHRTVALLGVGGSGKTYTLAQILKKRRVLALAPTHKARLNLSQNGFTQTETVQKIVYQLDHHQVIKNLEHCEVILIDEISMLTMSQLAQLCHQLPAHCRLILIGDDCQLPPVSLDDDVLEICGYAIKLIQEQGAHFDFCDNHRCRNLSVRTFIAQVRQRQVNLTTHEFERLTESKESMLTYKLKHPQPQACLILAYRNATIAKINQFFYQQMSPDVDQVLPFFIHDQQGMGGFFKGAQVIFYENDAYNHYGFTNSEMGEVECITGRPQHLIIQVKTAYGVYRLPQKLAIRVLRLAYALTIHKAQGSGAQKIYLLEAPNYQLLYTAVSRTQQELVFVDFKQATFYSALQHTAPTKQNIATL